MQCTVHYKALEDIFLHKANPIASAAITASLLGVTKNIIEEYNTNLKSNQLFTAWFAAAQQKNRFKNVTNRDGYLFPNLNGMHSDYLIATFYSGQKYIVSVNAAVNTVDKTKLENWGIDVMPISSLPVCSYSGDNPIEYIRLKENGNTTPYILKKYFVKEKKIIVYDKYFKSGALDVVLNLCKSADPNATITIITSNPPESLSAQTICSAINAACPSVTVNVKCMSNKTFSNLHDRYIFIGGRYVIKFTKGIDCFYTKSGCWANKIGDVIVDDNQTNFTNYKIELEDLSSINVKLSS